MSFPVPIQCISREYEANREKYLHAFDEVCKAAAYCDGGFVHRFERRFAAYLGAGGCSGVNSGTSALFLTMKALGVGAGDEVIVPSATFFATASTVLMTGAKPVFSDCDPETWQISPQSVEQSVTPRTKLIVGVHLFGGAFPVNAVGEIAKQAGIPFIEDACQAAGTKIGNRFAGSFGAAGCFSFYPTKNLGAFGEGGAVVSDNAELIEKVGFLKKHAQTPDGDHTGLGFNMRMEGIQGAVLDLKLDALAGNVARRRKIAAYYNEALRGHASLVSQKSDPGTEHGYHLFVVKPRQRDVFIKYMADRGIETGVHYPLPCHLQTVFRRLGSAPSLPNTEELCSRCVSVPVSPYLTDAEVDTVFDALKKFCE